MKILTYCCARKCYPLTSKQFDSWQLAQQFLDMHNGASHNNSMKIRVMTDSSVALLPMDKSIVA